MMMIIKREKKDLDINVSQKKIFFFLLSVTNRPRIFFFSHFCFVSPITYIEKKRSISTYRITKHRFAYIIIHCLPFISLFIHATNVFKFYSLFFYTNISIIISYCAQYSFFLSVRFSSSSFFCCQQFPVR